MTGILEKNKAPQPSPLPNKWLIFFLVGTGIFMSTLDGSIVNIALPAIMKDLSGTFAHVEWVVMVYLLIVSALLLGFGSLRDIVGRRIIYSIECRWGHPLKDESSKKTPLPSKKILFFLLDLTTSDPAKFCF